MLSSLLVSSSPCLVSWNSLPWMIVSLSVCCFPAFFYVIAYLIPQIYMGFFRSVPNLRLKYQTEWALVTGAGSGIGRALAFRLASGHGLNVVLVSLDDDALKRTFQDLQQEFPKLQFRAVGVTFAPHVPYLDKIQKATQDLDIGIVFSNAGYLLTGFLDQTPLDKLLANMECNATAAVNIAHFFLSKWVPQKRKGCLVFTSSVAAFIPTPFSVLYAATKAFCSQLAASLHIECQPLGIDVCAVHPSPVATPFYEKLEHKVDMIQAAAKSAIAPQLIVDDIFKSIGACALRDLGTLAWATRLGTFFIPYNLFSEIFATAAPYMADWKTHNQKRFATTSANLKKE